MNASAMADPLDDDLVSVIDGLEQFVHREIIKRHESHGALLSNPRRTYDESGRYVPEVIEIIKDVREASSKAGYFNMCVPTSLGGGGLGYLAYFEGWKRVFSITTPHEWLAGSALSHWAFGPSIALEGLTDRAKEEALPGLMGGRELMCFGMSEPDAGSDALAMKTLATPVDGGWKVNGRKIWTSYAPIASWILLFAVTDPELAAQRRGGVSAFMVPMSSPGIEVHSIIRMFGEIGGIEGEVALDDVFVEPWQVVGDLHRGFATAMRGVSLGRVYNTARGYAIGRWALNVALDYVTQRKAFGTTIANHQAVLHPLAESAAELHAAHTVAINTCRRLDAGHTVRKELAMMKYVATKAGVRAADRAIQAHGAMGFTNELGLTDAYATLRRIRVADGTDEILLRTIGQALIEGDREI